MLRIMFKLGACAEQNWRKLCGFACLAEVIVGVKLMDGEEVQQSGPGRRLICSRTSDLTIAYIFRMLP